jgi:hypothetical protein
MEILRQKQDVFEAFADDSLTGSEYVKAEKSIAAAIIAKEKENISKHQVNDDIDDE